MKMLIECAHCGIVLEADVDGVIRTCWNVQSARASMAASVAKSALKIWMTRTKSKGGGGSGKTETRANLGMLAL